MQMNWNPFKRTSAVAMLAERVDLHHVYSTQNQRDIESMRKVWADALRAHRLLELRVKELESKQSAQAHSEGSDVSKVLKKLADEKKAHARTYAREYYYRKVANKPLVSEAKRTLNFKKRKDRKEEAVVETKEQT
jgi:hypothetical protein